MLQFIDVQIYCLFCVMTGLCASIRKEDFILQSNNFPADVRFRPPIGNGHIATNVLSDTVYMNGLYNGYQDRSSRARIPAYVSVDVTKEDDVDRQFALDMYQGIFRQHILTDDVAIDISYLAHRKLTRLLVTRLYMRRRSDSNSTITVKLVHNVGDDSTDLEPHFNSNTTLDWKEGFSYFSGSVTEPETNDTVTQVLHIYYTKIPDVVSLPPGLQEMTSTFFASHSLDQKDALEQFNNALDDTDGLLMSHIEAMHSLWIEGHVYIDGNKELMQNVTAAMYNIMCSLPVEEDTVTPFYGLGPGGLSRGGLLVPEKPGGPKNDYAGHVFWDMDTWVMPPVMLFHPDMALRMIGSRIRVINQAKQNAKKDGYDGIKFPWEQASSGIEVTPKWAGQMALYQHHVTADVSYSLRQYLYANDDKDVVVKGRGLELALEIARFWKSRVIKTDNDTVQILGVMGPDEYHYNINNSVFTNYNAKLSLLLPRFIVEKFSISINDSIKEEMDIFESLASKMLILFNEQDQYHEQYEGFSFTSTIKQSDVVLLGYPLMMDMSPEVRRNDLELYERVTNPHGPDTGTWSMHTVGWLELGDPTRAAKNFKMMLRNINGPFKVFSEKPVTENATGGCVNFITGAGGLLQAILFGYGGLRLHSDKMTINPHLLPDTDSWGMSGLHYRGVEFNLDIHKEKITITVTDKPEDVIVNLEEKHSGNTIQLELLSGISLTGSEASLTVTHATDPSSTASRVFYIPGLMAFIAMLQFALRCFGV